MDFSPKEAPKEVRTDGRTEIGQTHIDFLTPPTQYALRANMKQYFLGVSSRYFLISNPEHTPLGETEDKHCRITINPQQKKVTTTD